MSGPKALDKGDAIIWADDLGLGVKVRDQFRADRYNARLLDGRAFTPGEKPPRCALVVFVAVRLASEIEAAYRADGYPGSFVVLGLDGNPVPAAANTAMSPAAVAAPARKVVAEVKTVAPVVKGTNVPAPPPIPAPKDGPELPGAVAETVKPEPAKEAPNADHANG